MMKFFTPQMCVRLNSRDDLVVDSAMAEWKGAWTAYKAHLAKLSGRMPQDVRRLAALNLHDGTILAWSRMTAVRSISRRGRSGGGSRPADRSTVAVELNGEITSITYALSGGVRVSPRRSAFPFHVRDHVDWLHDEVDAGSTPRGDFVHRALLSDGRVVEVPFTSVLVHQFSLSRPSSRQVRPA